MSEQEEAKEVIEGAPVAEEGQAEPEGIAKRIADNEEALAAARREFHQVNEQLVAGRRELAEIEAQRAHVAAPVVPQADPLAEDVAWYMEQGFDEATARRRAQHEMQRTANVAQAMLQPLVGQIADMSFQGASAQAVAELGLGDAITATDVTKALKAEVTPEAWAAVDSDTRARYAQRVASLIFTQRWQAGQQKARERGSKPPVAEGGNNGPPLTLTPTATPGAAPVGQVAELQAAFESAGLPTELARARAETLAKNPPADLGRTGRQ